MTKCDRKKQTCTIAKKRGTDVTQKANHPSSIVDHFLRASNLTLRVLSKKVVGTNQLKVSLGRELLGLEPLSLRGQGSGEC